MKYLFISNVRADAEDAKMLIRNLENANFKLLFDNSEGDSREVSSQSAFAIERSDGFILVLSSELTDDSRALGELEIAEKAGKPIQLVRLLSQPEPVKLEPGTSGRKLIDLSQNFEEGFQQLLTSLNEDNFEKQDTNTHSGSIDKRLELLSMLPGEELVWSEQGYYWHNKWRNLVRVTTHLSTLRLFFDWDERDLWKWKNHEQEELTQTFPISVKLSQISQVGDVQKPKTFLVFATSEPFVEVSTKRGDVLKFTLHAHFEQHVEILQRLVARSALDARENASE